MQFRANFLINMLNLHQLLWKFVPKLLLLWKYLIWLIHGSMILNYMLWYGNNKSIICWYEMVCVSKQGPRDRYPLKNVLKKWWFSVSVCYYSKNTHAVPNFENTIFVSFWFGNWFCTPWSLNRFLNKKFAALNLWCEWLNGNSIFRFIKKQALIGLSKVNFI